MGKLQNVEAGRGIAALLVVLFHTTKYYFSSPQYWPDAAFGGVFLFGHAGVEFFFVLSGYIMLKVHYRDIGLPGKVVPFLRKRFVRIYPFFWLILAVTVALFLRFPSMGQSYYRDPLNILQSFVLVGAEPLNAVVFVSWSLWHEVIFYALCALVILKPRIGVVAFLSWIAACAVLQFLDFTPPWPGYMTRFINLLFAFGVASALFLRSYKLPLPSLFLVCGVVLFFGTGLWMDYGPPIPEWSSRVLFGLGSALSLLGAVELERCGRLTAPRFLGVLGAASFSIYLTHMLVLPLFAKLAVKLGLNHSIPTPLAFIGLALVAVLAGVAIHFLVEKPMVKAWSPRRPQQLAAQS